MTKALLRHKINKMKALNHPLVKLALSLVRISAGLYLIAVQPNFFGPDTFISYALGGLLCVTGVFTAYNSLIGDKRRTQAPLLLDEVEITEVQKMIRDGEYISAIDYVRRKTGASLAEATALVEDLRSSSK